MKKLIFVAAIVLSTIISSCNTTNHCPSYSKRPEFRIIDCPTLVSKHTKLKDKKPTVKTSVKVKIEVETLAIKYNK